MIMPPMMRRLSRSLRRRDAACRLEAILSFRDITGIYFEAASNADVFGGMGSWNDGPAAKAATEGKLEEYNKLSDMLFNQIALAVMYAINQW